MNPDYDSKSADYFAKARREIEPLLQPNAERVLEIGCGEGETVRWLKDRGRARRAWGVEVFESAAVQARKQFEEVLVGDAETLVATAFAEMQFDLILCLDVLEHMVDPWRCVETLQERLAPGGKLVISVPNVRCLKVLVPLVFRGQWRYADHGILDRTHLRFFTRETALALAAGRGLQVERCIDHTLPGTQLDKLNRLSFGRLSGFTALQFLIASSRVP